MSGLFSLVYMKIAVTNQQIRKTRRLLRKRVVIEIQPSPRPGRAGKPTPLLERPLRCSEISEIVGVSVRIIRLIGRSTIAVIRHFGNRPRLNWCWCQGCGSIVKEEAWMAACRSCRHCSWVEGAPAEKRRNTTHLELIRKFEKWTPRDEFASIAPLDGGLAVIAAMSDANNLRRLPRRIEKIMHREIYATADRLRAVRTIYEPNAASGRAHHFDETARYR